MGLRLWPPKYILWTRQWVRQYFVQGNRGNGMRTVTFISIIFSRQKLTHRRFLRKSVQNGPSKVTCDFLLCHSRKNGNRSRRFPAVLVPFPRLIYLFKWSKFIIPKHKNASFHRKTAACGNSFFCHVTEEGTNFSFRAGLSVSLICGALEEHLLTYLLTYNCSCSS